MLLIIDNQSAYLRKFKRNYLDDQDIPHRIVDHNEQIDWATLPEVSGLMLSGGKGNPYEPLNLTTNYIAMMTLDVPTIGFCLGHEIIGVAYQARIKRMTDYQNKKQDVHIRDLDDPLFAKLTDPTVSIQKKHSFHMPRLPKDFRLLADSDACPIEIMRHEKKPIYGFQGHPEVSGKTGIAMMATFVEMCGLEGAGDGGYGWT